MKNLYFVVYLIVLKLILSFTKKLNFINYGLKGGFTYKISGRHFFTANGSMLSRTPEVNNLFTSPRVRNDLISGVSNELVTSTDINYSAKFPGFKLRLTYPNSCHGLQFEIDVVAQMMPSETFRPFLHKFRSNSFDS
mgnify:CR=1 FL=1